MGVVVIVAVGVILAVGVIEGMGVMEGVGVMVGVEVTVFVGVKEGVGGMIRYTTSRPEIWTRRARIVRMKPTNNNRQP